MGGGIAFFDFDGTLVRGDSLMPFLGEVVGWYQARLALVHAMRSAVAGPRTPEQDFRTRVKAGLLLATLKGVSRADACAAAARLAAWPRWLTPQVEALKAHHQAGHRVVIATGALDLYMPFLIADLPVDAVIATGLDCRDGILTGLMREGNNVRGLKARRVQAYLDANGPFAETWGYGNRPSDLPMLALLQHPTVI